MARDAKSMPAPDIEQEKRVFFGSSKNSLIALGPLYV